MSLAVRRLDTGSHKGAQDLSSVAAGADEGLGLIDEPARAHADNPIPGRGFSAEQAGITLGRPGSPRPVIVKEVILGTMPDCPGICRVLQAHERAPVLGFSLDQKNGSLKFGFQGRPSDMAQIGLHRRRSAFRPSQDSQNGSRRVQMLHHPNCAQWRSQTIRTS